MTFTERSQLIKSQLVFACSNRKSKFERLKTINKVIPMWRFASLAPQNYLRDTCSLDVC